ncbi:MAG: tetratricopeptide repeat protein [Magnetococcales bacterium]|nr:tetratricopeptide repeat protein [Magnetococcales bacterium]NGZ25332.1 tetratricopeptide repeat protein [Magnetococcales bacterium]
MNRQHRRSAKPAPGQTKDWFAEGIGHLERGQWTAAQECFLKIASEHPARFAALANLGWIALQQNRPREAVELLLQSLALQPDEINTLNTLGVAWQSLGEHEEAVLIYQKILQQQPQHSQTLFNLATAHQELGQLEQAAETYKTLLNLQPNHVESWCNLGLLNNLLSQADAAQQCYRKALTLKPNHVDAINNLALTLKGLGQLEEAEKLFRRGLRYAPEHVETLSNLGLLLLENHQLTAAQECLQKAIILAPQRWEIRNHLGMTLQKQGNLEAAEECYRQILAESPHALEALNNLGVLLHEGGQLAEAEHVFRTLLKRQPDNGTALVMAHYCAQYQCKWTTLVEDGEALCQAVRNGVVVQPFPLLSLPYELLNVPSPLELQQQAAVNHAKKHYPPLPSLAPEWRFDPQPQRLKIGYLSHDFRNHPVACLAASFFASHHRQQFEIIAYSYGEDDGQETRRQVMQAADRFVDIRSLDHDATARLIAADGIHILVEMTGHTKGSRLAITSRRPAPLQVALLGYPATLGCDFLDYFVASRHVIPQQAEKYYTEKVILLPNGVLPNDWRRQTVQLQTPRRLDYGLPEQGLILANFNANYKITPQVFDIWMDILRQQPDSILWLWSSNPQSIQELRRQAQERGVAAQRLHFAPWLPYEQHLSLFRLVDLFLDTYPYNASSTANDALWAGCPLLTCQGETCISRSAGVQVIALGLGELVTDSLADYAQLAKQLVANPHRLQELRQRLALNRTTTTQFDTQAYTRSLEAAYQAIWQRFSQGLPPQSMEITCR